MSDAADTLIGHLRSRFASGIWSAIASALPRAALLVAGLYVARQSGPDAFAQYSLALITVILGGNLVATALMNLGSKSVPELAHAQGGRAGAGFASLLGLGGALAVALGLSVYALAPFAAGLFGLELALTGVLQVAAIVVVAVVIHGSVNGLIMGSARFATAAVSTIAGSAAFVLALVPLSNAWGIAGTLLSLGLLYAVTAAFEGWSARHGVSNDFRSTPRGSRFSQWWPSAGFLAPMLLYIAMFPIVVWIANALLVRGPSPLLNVARFNAAYNWYAVATFVPNVLAQVEFVHFSRAKARGEMTQLSRILRYSILQNLLTMLVVVGAGIILAGPLMDLFRVNDADGRLCLRLMLVAACLTSLGVPTGLLFTVTDRIWIATALNIGWALMTLSTAWLLRDTGAVGIATAFVVAYAVHFVCALALAVRVARNLGRPVGGTKASQ
jgi:O-antigen/teichoic acid export membrane protein